MRPVDEQLEILMGGTRFADEADDWDVNISEGRSLRTRMGGELREKIEKDRPLRVYLGIDPTSTDLHIGHFVPIQKLRKFQDLGHHVIFLIGDYTATIGDPSGQDNLRRRVTHELVRKLAEDYTNQAFRILDSEKTEVRYNSEWLSKLTFPDMIALASLFPMKQIIARRDFQQRMNRGESLRFHEALYALMQGYDAYVLKCDVQVGAYDQHFNMLAGRTIQEHFGDKPHVMITNPLLTGTDGRKMSKSYGNAVNINDVPFDMYGKTMRLSDEQIIDSFKLASSLNRREIDALVQQLDSGANPMQIKKKLAFNLVLQYHGEQAALKAEDEFRRTIQNKDVPEAMPEIEVMIDPASKSWVDLCAELGLSRSRGDMRRLIEQGGFYMEQQPMKDVKALVHIPAEGVIIRLGKRRYYRLKITPQ